MWKGNENVNANNLNRFEELLSQIQPNEKEWKGHVIA